MPGKEKEIFRDCYDILKANLAKPKMENKDWEVLKLQSSRLTTEKYTEFDDKMLCVALMGVVVDHLMRKKVSEVA